jgi:hypothetical protein
MYSAETIEIVSSIHSSRSEKDGILLNAKEFARNQCAGVQLQTKEAERLGFERCRLGVSCRRV